jgi:phage terminase large subunit
LESNGLGQLGIQSGAIYNDWSQIDLPINAELLGSGLDFGFSNDPSALISVYRYNGEIIIDSNLSKGFIEFTTSIND